MQSRTAALPTATLPTWYRVLAVVVGLITIGLAIVFLAFPGLALLTVVFLLGFILLIIGFDRLISGITGHPYSFMPMGAGPFMGGTPPGSPGAGAPETGAPKGPP